MFVAHINLFVTVSIGGLILEVGSYGLMQTQYLHTCVVFCGNGSFCLNGLWIVVMGMEIETLNCETNL